MFQFRKTEQSKMREKNNPNGAVLLFNSCGNSQSDFERTIKLNMREKQIEQSRHLLEFYNQHPIKWKQNNHIIKSYYTVSCEVLYFTHNSPKTTK